MTETPRPDGVPQRGAGAAAIADGPPRLAAAAFAISAARAVQMLVVFALTIPLTRILPKTAYGVYAHAVFLAAVAPFAVSTAAGRTVAFFVPRAARPTHVLRCVAVGLTIALVGAGAAIAFVPGVLAALDPTDVLLREHRVVVGAIVAASFPYAAAEQVMLVRGVRRGYTVLLLTVALALLVFIGGALAFAPEARRLEMTLYGLFGATCVQGAAGLVWLVLPAPTPQRSRPGTPISVGDLARFAAPVALASLLGLVAMRIDGLWVPRFFGALKPEYLRGAMEIPVVGALAFTLLNLAAPALSQSHAEGNVDELLRTWRRTCRLVALAAIPVAGTVFVAAEDLFLLVYPGYGNGVPVFRWYVLLLVVRLFMPQTLLEFTGAAGRALAAAAIHAVLAVALTAVLATEFGWRGVPAATIAAAWIAQWAVGGALARRHLGVGWSDLLDWRWTGAMLASASAVAAGVHVVASLDAVAELGRFARAGMEMALFIVSFAIVTGAARLWTTGEVLRAVAVITRRADPAAPTAH